MTHHSQKKDQIHWHQWGAGPFWKAQQENKLVLLLISNDWCRLCRLMEETSYANTRVINYLNQHFISIRVNSNEHPEIEERYNLGDLPTTAVLSPEGYLITGGTDLSPKQMLEMLEEVQDYYRDEPGELIERAREFNRQNSEWLEIKGREQNINWDNWDQFVYLLEKEYDPVYAGFGSYPKYPMTESLELAVTAGLVHRNQTLTRICTDSLLAMAGSAMFDQVEGGFFRSSLTRDWKKPEYAKTLEDNAGLLKLLMLVYQATGEPRFLEIAQSVFRFLYEVLYFRRNGCFGGAQGGDEKYYSLGLEERLERPAPHVDHNIYVNLNSSTAETLLIVANFFEDETLETSSLKILDKLWENAYREGKGLAHCYPDNTSDSRLLIDQEAYGRAALRAYQQTGNKAWLSRSLELADFCIENLLAPQGAFWDIIPDPQAPGMLKEPRRNLQANARTSRWLMRLAELTGNQEYGKQARDIIVTLEPLSKHLGLAASSYALAMLEALHPWTKIRIVGRKEEPETRVLHQLALANTHPAKVVELLDPQVDPAEIQALNLSSEGPARAYVSIGSRHWEPVQSAGELEDLLAGLEVGKNA